jgi:phospholipid transport system substrate-binding protein
MIRKPVTSIGLITALVFVFCLTAVASEQTKAVETLLKTKIDGVLNILSQAEVSDESKRQQVMALITPVINFSLMAKLTLGKANWGRLTPEERTRFVDLFVERLKASYLNKVTLYTDQKVVYEKAIESSGKIHVPTYLEAKDGRIEIIYRFYSANDQWQVYDVEIDGVSFIKSYRSQFDEVLKNGTVDDLFAQLAKTEDNREGGTDSTK